MKTVCVGILLISCLSIFQVAFGKKIQANMKDHGYDGELVVDPKTGLLQPHLDYPGVDAADQISLGGPYAHLYCKILDSGSIFHERYYRNYCQKEENGKKIDLCCTGYKCESYGILSGVRGYCKRNK